MSRRYAIVSNRPWNRGLAKQLTLLCKDSEWLDIQSKEDFNENKLSEFKPEIIFIPHWSYLIPENIFSKWDCIVFHMTDLPFGRGGSPLQNLISQGYTNTKISAIKVQKELDAGPIYLKKELFLLGTAEEIFIRANNIIKEMVVEIIGKKLIPQEQTGVVTEFKRRKQDDSNVSKLDSIDKLYDYIRMLDAEGYPAAFFEIGKFRLELSRASLKSGGVVIADVKITEKEGI